MARSPPARAQRAFLMGVPPPNTFPGPSPVSVQLLLTLLLAKTVPGWGGLTGRAAPAAPGAR